MEICGGATPVFGSLMKTHRGEVPRCCKAGNLCLHEEIISSPIWTRIVRLLSGPQDRIPNHSSVHFVLTYWDGIHGKHTLLWYSGSLYPYRRLRQLAFKKWCKNAPESIALQWIPGLYLFDSPWDAKNAKTFPYFRSLACAVGFLKLPQSTNSYRIMIKGILTVDKSTGEDTQRIT